jgi:hypothetical protein
MTDNKQIAPQISKCFGSLPKCECREIYDRLLLVSADRNRSGVSSPDVDK